MIPIVSYIKRNPRSTKRLIGLSEKHLNKLIDNAQKYHHKKKSEIAQTEIRLIKAGGGRKSLLNTEEQIILTLYYLHNHPTFEILGIHFNVSESTANNVFHYWVNILSELLPSSLLEQVKKNTSDEKWVKEILTELELIVDSCEQDRERPLDYKEQKKYYSGKKKRHTFKNQLITTPDGQEIVDVIVGYPGPKSDIILWREQSKNLEKTQRYNGDKAYYGEDRIKTPKKKPKNQEMPPEIKEDNQKKSRDRIFVEHLIRVIKTFRVASERFRLNSKNYSKVILTVCGLVRLRIGALILS
ncbi:MAG: transposase [Moorea sp. SIO3I7]|uniref:transposase family protein n=1 Tax=unclassified Moorena TaxID=2683338 RepID=UPI0013CA3809|nr:MULTISPECIES: transposase family protein [unclassified Moorena]NEN98978.1 transposase [Moorena sp. SIO3I7]NEO25225.1 transposase [Moorena sp. SIO4A5]NEQ62768.1 transposase [Moorena sp. SIO4A1]